jgi:hypothetical protein
VSEEDEETPETDRLRAQAADLCAARRNDTAFALYGLGRRAEKFIERLSIVCGSVSAYDERERHLKRIAPECRFRNRAPRRG